jgi:hypothetical protein
MGRGVKQKPVRRGFLSAATLALFLVIVPLLGANRATASPVRPNNTGEKSKLVALAAALFPNLTRAEVALLEHANVKNVGRAEYAASGPSSNPDDSSNDPAKASQWGPQREIRASLIRWMSVDPDAIRQIDPQGLRVLGAKIVGRLDLSQVRVPFAITLRNCAISEPMELGSSEIPALDLQGSYTGAIHAASLNVPNVFSLDQIHLTGIADLNGATLGTFTAADGHFKYAAEPGYALAQTRTVLNLGSANIRGSVYLFGFEADGDVALDTARIGGDLNCASANLFNPGNVAIEAISTVIGGGVYFMSAESEGISMPHGGPFKVSGEVRFRATQIGTALVVWQAIFSGPPGTPHGFFGPGMTVHGFLIWNDVTMDGAAQVVLNGASVGVLVDPKLGWPASGNLLIDGFTYSSLGSAGAVAPLDARTRLEWIALQNGYHPQPYRQLAKVLRDMGDEKGAVEVLVAEGDARYRQMGLPGRLLGGFLKFTIGYGHRPLLALFWSFGVVLIGWLVIAIAKRANLMRPTWPENALPENRKSYERLRPLVYSLDVFLPFVNLHQEHYWWPDADASGQCTLFGLSFQCSGEFFRIYVWAQIVAGWLLSAIFIAGVTGLIRND